MDKKATITSGVGYSKHERNSSIMAQVSGKFEVEERFCGMAAVRRAKRLTEKKGWRIEVIENANGCFGMYARTDCLVTRPMTSIEAGKRIDAINEELGRRAVIAKIEREVPRAVLEAGFIDCRGRARISTADCKELDLICPRTEKDAADLSLVLKVNFPSLNSYERRLIYTSLRVGKSQQMPFTWAAPDENRATELEAELRSYEAYRKTIISRGNSVLPIVDSHDDSN